MRTTISRPVIKRCPHVDEVDAGTLTVVFNGPAPELHLLAEHVERLASTPISHEDFTIAVAALLPTDAKVTTTWNTGPWAVEVLA